MKNLLITSTLLIAAAFTTPKSARADYYGWQCNWQTYCNTYGYCWQREQCCRWHTDAYGFTFWQCVWR